MAFRRRFKPPIPKGWQIFAAGLAIAGTHIDARRTVATRFARGSAQELAFVAEPTNAHDKNAIRVEGTYRGWFLAHKVHLGYVPRDVSEALVATELLPKTRPRVKSAWIGDSGQVEIAFDLIGLKADRGLFERFFVEKARAGSVSDQQKEFSRFFDLKLPKDANFGAAQDQINAFVVEQEKCSPNLLAEWEFYWHIYDELTDPDNRDIYCLKKVSRKVLQEALENLKSQGNSLEALADDPNLVSDWIIEKYPELEIEFA